MRSYPFPIRVALYGLSLLTIVLALLTGELRVVANQARMVPASATRIGSGSVNQAFEEAAREFGVPISLLKAICYMEGRLSNNGGSPSIDNGYGCMHLIQNSRGDLLDHAARALGVSAHQLKLDLPTNIRGGAALLRDDALQLSRTHSLPTRLSDWYGALAVSSHATTRSAALMYAGAVYTLLAQGFSAQADDGETITLVPQNVQPDTLSATAVQGINKLPSGCKLDQNVDYPQAVDCLVSAHTFDCNQTPKNASCTYEDAQRPTDYAIDQIVIHDIEGTAQSSLNVFQNPKTAASVHYIIDSDGTIYQVVREKDIAYHAGNYWYNQHSIGIEHAGVDATGYRWYNASEYLASAKLTAYLLKKYNLPLNHEQIVSHATIPSPSATSLPNHVDPGPYWLWDYYLKLIHEQSMHYPSEATSPNIFLLRPSSDRRPLGARGAETDANFNFIYLYNGPSTSSGRIPQLGNGHDITDVSGCVEPDISYYYLAKVVDPAGSGDTMYKIWYGVVDHPTSTKRFVHARLAWLAVPRGAAGRGEGIPVVLNGASGQKPLIYGQPTTGSTYVLGDAPAGAIFVSAYTVTEDSIPTNNGSNTGGTGDTTNNGNNTGGTGDTTNNGDPGSTNGGDNQTGNMDGAGNIGDQNSMAANGIIATKSKNRRTDGVGNLWYEINYNHRQAWVPASEVTVMQVPGGQ